MVQDSDDLLVHSRAPNLGQGPKSLPSESMSSLATSSTLQPRLNLNFTPMSAEQQRKLSQNLNNHVPTAPLVEGGSDSLTSFKSCTSDPNLNNLVPKKVSESYGGSGQPQPQTPAKIPLPTLVVTSRSSKDRTRSPSAPVEHRRSKTGSPPPQALDNKENVIQGVRHLSRDRWKNTTHQHKQFSFWYEWMWLSKNDDDELFSREIDFSFCGKNKPCRMNMIDTYRFKSECILQKKEIKSCYLFQNGWSQENKVPSQKMNSKTV